MVNAIVAAIFSFLIPGLGQFLSGNIKKGVVFFIFILIIWAVGSLIFKHWIVCLVDILYSLFAAYDAYQMAQYS